MKKLYILALLILTVVISRAQDIHYSQFYASPLTLNPALTGINDCNYRACINYKNQWHSISAPTTYTTPSLSFDINNLAARYIKKGVLSAGMLVLQDQAGDGNLSNLSILGSAGYMYTFDAKRIHNVSLGIQTGYVQKKVDPNKLDFEDQFNGTDFDHTLSNNEPFAKLGFGYLDFNAGILYLANISPKYSFYAGGAAFHLIQPKETFLNNPNSKLGMRMVVHAGGKAKLNDVWSIYPSVLYMTQSAAQEINFGTNVGYHVSNANMEAEFYFGGYYRWDDAVNVLVGGEYKSVKLGLSYDVNISSLNSATNSKGGFELSLSYTGCIGGLILDPPVLWCPRF